jgi:16S rRNA (guanine(966)-N(2))-methyltransferase RsmD
VRIVGGEARGRTLHAVPGSTTRPTADRVRQSLFDVLGQRCDGLAVLDLYAGTGALALEALSRGAAAATLVEKDAKACAVIERNVAELGFGARCTLLRDDVGRALLRQRRAPFGLVFSDPPYALRAAQATLDAVATLLAPGGRLVLEMDKREPLPAGLALLDDRLYGDTRVAIFVRE